MQLTYGLHDKTYKRSGFRDYLSGAAFITRWASSWYRHLFGQIRLFELLYEKRPALVSERRRRLRSKSVVEISKFCKSRGHTDMSHTIMFRKHRWILPAFQALA